MTESSDATMPRAQVELDQGTADEQLNGETPALREGGYGWVCVGCCFSIGCFTWGAVSSFGVYLAYYLKHDVFPGASSVDFALIGGLIFAMAMLVAPIVTTVTRHFDIQVPMLVGVAFQTSGFIGASFAGQIWQLYLTQGVLVGIGLGFTWIPSIAIISQWFWLRRSLAQGITAAGAGVGGLIFSFLTSAVIEKLSLPWSLRITGIICAVINIVATTLIRSRNKEIRPKQLAFDTSLLKNQEVVLVLTWGVLNTLGYIVLLYSLGDFATSIGLSGSQGATVIAILNLMTAIGRPATGFLSDKYGRIETAGIITLLCAVSIFALWIPAQSYGLLLLFASVNGLIFGVFWVTVGPIYAEVVGLVELPSALSITWLITVLPLLFSEVIALELRHPSSDRPFLYPQIFTGTAYLVATVVIFRLWQVRRRNRLIR